MTGWAVLVALVSGASPAQEAPDVRPLYTELRSTPPPPPMAATNLPDMSHLAQAAMPAVVGVVTTQGAPASTDDALKDLLDRLHDGPRRGIGSGFVIHKDGWIITNAHVIEGAEQVEVDLGENDPRYGARVVGTDSESDIALLKIQPQRPLAVLPLGDSDKVSVAEWVLVIGSPFGLDHSVTVGVVSHTGRNDISPVGRPGAYDFIQTDASINPGNSGGPMLNLRGEVVGIATAVNATGQGIGFAIPINMAKEIVGQLQSRGRVVRSWLGVAVREVPAGEGAGVVVTEVSSGGPADAAGVRPGDVITGIAGHQISNPARLRWYVSTAGVGREVDVRVRRSGATERTVRVALRAVPTDEAGAAAPVPSSAPSASRGR
jgi:serine protease Do